LRKCSKVAIVRASFPWFYRNALLHYISEVPDVPVGEDFPLLVFVPAPVAPVGPDELPELDAPAA
jgi:hypothetical protein